MKTGILICLLFGIYFAVAFSCQKKSKPFPYPESVTNTPDTSIGQQVWYYKGKYWLQTYVNTNKYQSHYSNNRGEPFMSLNGSYDEAPYNVEISGTFVYIKSNKQLEYKKAAIILDSLRKVGYAIQLIHGAEMKKQKLINDSLKLLQ